VDLLNHFAYLRAVRASVYLGTRAYVITRARGIAFKIRRLLPSNFNPPSKEKEMTISQHAKTLISKVIDLAKGNTHYNAASVLAALNDTSLNAASLAEFLAMDSYKESMVILRLDHLVWDLKEKSFFTREDLLFSIDIPNEAKEALHKEYYTIYNKAIVFANIALLTD